MTAPFRILVTGDNLAPAAVKILTEIGAEIVLTRDAITPERLSYEMAIAPTQAILMRGNPVFSSAVIASNPHLRVIAKHGAGVDSVDIDAATARRILVMVAGDANAPAVAEHTIALTLALGRDVVSLNARTHAGAWDRASYRGREVRGRTIGLVGFGRIARHVARAAAALGMTVVALGRSKGRVDPALAREAADLAELLAVSDIVSLHAPLTDVTRGMIDAARLAAMKPGAILINTARGALVDEDALRAALASGHLAGAGLDTLAEEPPAKDRPILQAPNLIVTPHIAAQTGASITRTGIEAARNIATVLTGGEIDRGNVVNPAALDPP
ncbi:hydroxyacid dehydrogenase [Bradyrhizobium tropiciagri]|uniref:hydroxyacid dehydrogenase n=1 Tax=Bradyrhizobium tropiciagri TaxID=312253 RepID=UPI001BAD77B3|nr:hydroxyacid dehydrogenase [Bradyrhizobium tropiciagri]MBR0897366.1 hydroxyacid dehydrogenase [Bradyrhizobium tropiciagri]